MYLHFLLQSLSIYHTVEQFPESSSSVLCRFMSKEDCEWMNNPLRAQYHTPGSSAVFMWKAEIIWLRLASTCQTSTLYSWQTSSTAGINITVATRRPLLLAWTPSQHELLSLLWIYFLLAKCSRSVVPTTGKNCYVEVNHPCWNVGLSRLITAKITMLKISERYKLVVGAVKTTTCKFYWFICVNSIKIKRLQYTFKKIQKFLACNTIAHIHIKRA